VPRSIPTFPHRQGAIRAILAWLVVERQVLALLKEVWIDEWQAGALRRIRPAIGSRRHVLRPSLLFAMNAATLVTPAV